MIRLLTAFIAGCLFAMGLSYSGMTLPAKVVGFLDFTGSWDPSLAFVMGGALSVFAPTFHITRKFRSTPLTGGEFDLPTRTKITPQLLVGGAIFGLGWAVSGFCPGTVLATLPSLKLEALWVTAGLLIGILGMRAIQKRVVEKPKDIPQADF